MNVRGLERAGAAGASGDSGSDSDVRRLSLVSSAPDRTQHSGERQNKRRPGTPQQPVLFRHGATGNNNNSNAVRTRAAAQKRSLSNHAVKALPVAEDDVRSAKHGLGTRGKSVDLDSGSDSEEQDGFVKVDSWKPPSEPLLPTFKPTIPSTGVPMPSTTPSTKGARPVTRLRNTLKATAGAESLSETAPENVAAVSNNLSTASPHGIEGTKRRIGIAGSDSGSSCSDEEISDVLDETEIQLIEAMEDTQITGANSKADLNSAQKQRQASTTASRLTPAVSLSRKPLRWIGLSQNTPTARTSFTDSLKERFSVSSKPSSAAVSLTRGSFDTDSEDSSEDGVDSHITVAADAPLVAASTGNASTESVGLFNVSEPGANNTATARAFKPPHPQMIAAVEKSNSAQNVASDSSSSSASRNSSVDAEGTLRSTSVPLEDVEFVAPGVAKGTATSLLRRVLDIDGPVVQQKMVEFLLIDGVMASLIGYITHCQGSIYSPSSSTQTAPCSPSLQPGDKAGHPVEPGSQWSARSEGNQQLPMGVLQEFEQRRQHRERLMRQRQRSSKLTETDLRRGFNATHMLSSRDHYARRVVEAKISVIVPCLMAVFHKDSLGSFHHACMLLEHCFTLAPLKTTRLLLYQQNPPSRWWWRSESVARGHAPICDLLPYLSEPCVQRLFLKAEFGVWTGRLMASLNLMPNDAVVVSDELNRIGLGSVASALGSSPGEDSAQTQAQTQQRTKAMQLVRNRFQQLNRGGFFGHILELIEDSDPCISESIAEFMSFMINDCSAFLGFNILFKPIYDSELPVRRLAQLIINSPSQHLTPQAKAAIRLLHTLLSKTSCQYGLRTREAQGIRDQEITPRGSQILVYVGHAARTALESFLPGLFATVTGQQENTDLTSRSAYNRRSSIDSLQLPEYEEPDPDIDVDFTETESSDGEEDNISSSDNEQILSSLELGQFFDGSSAEDSLSGNSSSDDDDDVRNEMELRDSATALLQATYPESIASGSISSSLSPSSTLSASPMAVASSTPERFIDSCTGERLDSEDLGLLVSLPKPDINRLNLLRICIEVLRESEDVDEIFGWIDLRVWRALSTWFLNHPHNNIIHMSVYQLLSIITLEAVRLRKAYRRRVGVDFSTTHTSLVMKRVAGLSYGYLGKTPNRSSGCRDSGASGSNAYLAAGMHDGEPLEPQGGRMAKHRVLRRRAMAEHIRHDEASNCDNVLTYLIEQHQWIDKLVRRATSPNFDGAHGYISLILNTLRIAVQIDRRRCTGSAVSYKSDPFQAACRSSTAATQQRGPAAPSGRADKEDTVDKLADEKQQDMAKEMEDKAMLLDLEYHDPSTRELLSEYPLYRLQRWEISLLYSPAFRAHLHTLRRQALLMAQKIVEFRLCDQSRTVISAEGGDGATGIQRPVPFFSPQKVKPPLLFDNTEIKRKQLQINVGLLLGNKSTAGSSSSSSLKIPATKAHTRDAVGKGKAGETPRLIDEVGVDANSLFARMLGFTEDLSEPSSQASGGDRSTNLETEAAATTASAQPGGETDAVTDDEDIDASKRRRDSKSATAKTRKSGTGDYGKSNTSRQKKSRPAPGSASVSGLFDELTLDTVADASEVISTALANEGNSDNPAATAGGRHSQSVRQRKKLATASGSVRRRRARLHHRTSSSSIGSTAAAQQPAAAAAAAIVASTTSTQRSKVLPADTPVAGLGSTMQSLDLEQ
ncbi:hypothetical protein COEREDRAFT_81207 [Coemansia reversa NRRL 1564]|uniref:Uncharacterized protein n=1 Tax=Coemansia reversa (strain ATCC 12441 / NRRL 1564) TaxID=763665 RepID=A0A2G5BC00_COERN|nr:hypothetical protein COEREDRAFT_81207 [Coemansia reversa NRRL 1564]|eukprot:PIA16544.1 hypothetical protein COEREDRAFT_81207 [Coemansia reversa NRRL 1564]